MDWEYLLEDGKAAKKYMGTVLSGEKLLDDKITEINYIVHFQKLLVVKWRAQD